MNKLDNVKMYNIRDGNDGIKDTVIIMSDIVKQGSSNPYVRKWAEKMVVSSERSKSDYIKHIYDFIRLRTKYLPDIVDVEFIKTPDYILGEIEENDTPQLDCDDYTVLSLSLYRSIGFPTAIRIISTSIDKVYSHVYGMVFNSEIDKWMPIDLTKSEFGPGWQFNKPTRKSDYLIDENYKSIEGISSLNKEPKPLPLDLILDVENDYVFVLANRYHSIDSFNLENLTLFLKDYVSYIRIDRGWFSTHHNFYLKGIKQSISVRSLAVRILEFLETESWITTWEFINAYVASDIKIGSGSILSSATEAIAKDVIDPLLDPINKTLGTIALVGVAGIIGYFLIINKRR